MIPGGTLLIINLILCALIAGLSYLIYKKDKDKLVFYIGISFGLFGFSHLINFLKLKDIFFIPLLIIRITAFILIIYALYKKIIEEYLSKKKKVLTYIIVFSILFTTTIQFFAKNNLVFNLNNITSQINLFLSTIIFLFAFLVYKKNKNSLALSISSSFFIFAISHIATLLNVEQNFYTLLVISRIIAYFILLTGIYLLIKEEHLDVIIGYMTSIKIQISIIFVMTGLLFALFYIPNKQFNSSDPVPKIEYIKPSDKDKEIKEVRTGIFIKNFPEFDIIKNEFVMNAIVWFEFDPRIITLDLIEDFSFDKGKILKKSKATTKIIDSKIWAYYKVKIEFGSDLDYKLFPLEDHKIYINLVNTSMNPDSEILVSYNTDLVTADQIFTGDWENVDKEVEYGYVEYDIDKYEKSKSTKYPIVSFSLSFEKAGIRKTLVIFLPLLMVFFLSLFSLLIHVKNKAGILSLSVGSTSALIFDLVAIEQMSPDVRYFTIANKIYTLLLISSVIILLLNIYSIKENSNENAIKDLILLRGYVFLFFVIFILLTTYSLIY